MEIKLNINERFDTLQIHVCNKELNQETKSLYDMIRGLIEEEITAYDGEQTVRIKPSEVIRFLAENKQVYVSTAQGQYRMKERLYELEERFCTETKEADSFTNGKFVRISNSEIVNVKKILRMDTSITGTIRMYLKGEIETFVSRRNVAKIKKALGL